MESSCLISWLLISSLLLPQIHYSNIFSSVFLYVPSEFISLCAPLHGVSAQRPWWMHRASKARLLAPQFFPWEEIFFLLHLAFAGFLSKRQKCFCVLRSDYTLTERPLCDPQSKPRTTGKKRQMQRQSLSSINERIRFTVRSTNTCPGLIPVRRHFPQQRRYDWRLIGGEMRRRLQDSEMPEIIQFPNSKTLCFLGISGVF